MSIPQNAAIEAGKFVAKVNDIVLFPLIQLMIGVALLVFLFGVAQYVFNASNEASREEGKKHMLWGIIGFVVMASALAIITIAINTFGLRDVLDCSRTPTAGGCDKVFKVTP